MSGLRVMLLNRRWPVVGLATVLLAAVSALLLAADEDRGLSATDRTEVAAVVERYMQAYAATLVTPQGLRSDVMSQRCALAEDGTPLRLGAAVLDEIDRNFEEAVRSCGTASFARRQLEWRDEYGLAAASALENSLNRLDISPMVSEKVEVLEVDPAGDGSGVTHAKVTAWLGDIRADGSRVESWAVYDYAMTEEGGEWRIDSQRETWHYSDADANQWGPSSPHDDGESTD